MGAIVLIDSENDIRVAKRDFGWILTQYGSKPLRKDGDIYIFSLFGGNGITMTFNSAEAANEFYLSNRGKILVTGQEINDHIKSRTPGSTG